MLRRNTKILRFTFVALSIAVFSAATYAVSQKKRIFNSSKPTLKTSAQPIGKKNDVLPTQETTSLSSNLRFASVAHDVGLVFKHTAGRSQKFLMPEIMGPGVTIFDANGDGYDDVFLLNGTFRLDKKNKETLLSTSKLFLNKKGSFDDITTSSGLNIDTYGTVATAFDIDGDRDRDLIVGTVSGIRIFINDGHAHFREETESRGIHSSGWVSALAPFDADDDGDLDLFIGHYLTWSIEHNDAIECKPDGKHRDYCGPSSFAPTSPQLFINDGKGIFTDQTRTSHLPVQATKALGVLSIDLNEDGRLDLIVANDQIRTQVFLNHGNRIFSEHATQLGFAAMLTGFAYAGMGIDASWHLPGNYGLCVGIGNFHSEPLTVHCRSDADPLFLPKESLLGIRNPTLPWVKFGLRFFDINLDGLDDLFVANGNLINDENTLGISFLQPLQVLVARNASMLDVSSTALGVLAQNRTLGRAVATFDFDLDGDTDVLATDNDSYALLLANQTENKGNFIALRLEGVAPNTDAIGASIKVSCGTQTYRAWVHVTGSYAAQSSLERIVGLGRNTNSVEVIVDWPSGRTQKFSSLAINQRHLLREDATLEKISKAFVPLTKNNQYALAYKALQQKRFQQAEQLFQELLREQPNHSEFLSGLAITEWSLGRKANALATLRFAIEQLSTFDNFQQQVLFPLIEFNENELTWNAFEYAIQKFQVENEDLWLNVGTQRAAHGRIDEAEQAFRKALTISPTCSFCTIELAIVLYQKKQFLDVITLLEPLLRAQPQNIKIRRTLGFAYMSLQRNEEASREFEAVLALTTTDDEVRAAAKQLKNTLVKQR